MLSRSESCGASIELDKRLGRGLEARTVGVSSGEVFSVAEEEEASENWVEGLGDM
jgi:hypothetical protein